ncbi:MAG TPA: response regulator transcription factor [Phycisphaerae bacterium]|nr:response regulator transcription factor [Phycisphaerae bacterium]
MNVRKSHVAGTDGIRIVIVDDHPIVRQGIKMLAAAEPDLVVCGEAENAAEALQTIGRSNPDVAIVDLSLKEGSGLELIKDIKNRYPKLLVLVLSMRNESFYAERVLRAGARAYITKEEGAERVIEGIRKILEGKIYLSERMASKVITKWVDGKTDSRAPSVAKLSDRELEVFELLGSGLSTRQIAGKLHISVKTVESHREHIKEKLEINRAAELLKHAIRWVQFQEQG